MSMSPSAVASLPASAPWPPATSTSRSARACRFSVATSFRIDASGPVPWPCDQVDRVAEQGGLRDHLDAQGGEPIAQDGIVQRAGGAAHGLDALDRIECELRTGIAQALVRQEIVGDFPPAMQRSDQVLGRNAHVVEEDFAELVVAGDIDDRAHGHAWTVELE